MGGWVAGLPIPITVEEGFYCFSTFNGSTSGPFGPAGNTYLLKTAGTTSRGVSTVAASSYLPSSHGLTLPRVELSTYQ